MTKPTTKTQESSAKAALPGQVVLVLQGGGALGAYQVGVYQALHESGIEPDWVVGTSIGAINGALIAGNAPEDRLARLEAFWQTVQRDDPAQYLAGPLGNTETLTRGIPGFFSPNLLSAMCPKWPVGVTRAAYYDTEPLGQTLSRLVNFELIRERAIRLTVGAVNVRSGALHYFDSRHQSLALEHIMASGALPPAFPAVLVDGEPYWDGGLYSNTPLEAVLDDNPRRDSLIFAVNMWHSHGSDPESVWQALARQKDIQYASRADSHIFRQHQLHRLRHVIQELGAHLPQELRHDPQIRELLSYGCTTRMHVVRLLAPRLPDEDVSKDIDFSAQSIAFRRAAGYRDMQRAIDKADWCAEMAPHEGMRIHD